VQVFQQKGCSGLIVLHRKGFLKISPKPLQNMTQVGGFGEVDGDAQDFGGRAASKILCSWVSGLE